MMPKLERAINSKVPEHMAMLAWFILWIEGRKIVVKVAGMKAKAITFKYA